MKYKSSWEDMSDYLVHFSKGDLNETPYEVMLGILFAGQLKAMNTFGFAKGYLKGNQKKSVCLSETPLHLIQRISERRGPYGIGFTKSFISARNGNPIIYVNDDSPLFKSFKILLDKALKSPNDESSKAFSEIAPFVDQVITKSKNRYAFQWEREWRVCSDIEFEPEDVAFLIIPEDLHEAARNFFDDAEHENTGPNYKCPFIDIGWTIEKIQKRLLNLK